MNKLYHGFVLLFCGACCTLSLVAWRKSADSGSQKTALADRIGLESLGTDQSIPAPSRLSPRMIRAFEQAHQSRPVSESPVVLASWASSASAPDKPTIVSVTEKTNGGPTLQWNLSKSKEVWLRSKELVLNLQSPLAGESCEITPLRVVPGTMRIQGDGDLARKEIALDSLGPGRHSLRFEFDDKHALSACIDSVNPQVIIHVPNEVSFVPNAVSVKRGVDYDWESLSEAPASPIEIYQNTNASLKFRRNSVGSVLLGIVSIKDDLNNQLVDRVVPISETMLYPTINEKTEHLVLLEIDSTKNRSWISNTPIELKTKAIASIQSLTISKIDSQDTGPDCRLSRPDAARTILLSGQPTISVEDLIKVYLDGQQVFKKTGLSGLACSLEGVKLSEGRHRLFATLSQGDKVVARTQEVDYDMQTGGFRVLEVSPKDFGIAIGSKVIEIKLSRPLADNSLDATDKTKLKQPTAVRVKLSPSGSRNGPFSAKSGDPNDPDIEVLPDRQRIQIKFTSVIEGVHEVSVAGDSLQDEYGNKLEGSSGKAGELYTAVLGAPSGGANRYADPLVPGVIAGRAPVVEYPQAIPVRDQPKGFNPNDRVETRVARLYFYRDAHRVAQILNRRAQSYGRQDVTYRRQLADQARREAEEATTKRQTYERSAVTAAQKTRELENKLNDTEQALNYTLNQMQQLAADRSTNPVKDKQLAQLEIAARAYTDQIRALESQVMVAREQETASNEQWLQSQRTEELNRAEQFRMETAAAHTDPDTFAEGRPDSVDAVHQVSISVIGEGILHLRGPLRGVNQVRLMVDQIDTPCGSVRINIHSTQINGDEADELEVVANRLQTYIDQARFMTMQSSEALRKAVLTIAAERADEARGMYPGDSQEERDQRYLYAFFGKDFVDELKALDSELLHTGNKLLSLHSMDVTSLSSAMTLMALANNSTRLAILARFDELVQSDLGPAEQRFLENSIAECNGKQCKLGCRLRCKHKEPPPTYHLTPSASFTSMRGFFDANIANDDTLNPIQREMIRLAQILKARLVTELELKQRVMERAVIEERLSAVESDQDLLRLEQQRFSQLRETTEQALMFRSTILPALSKATSQIDTAIEQYESISMELIEMLRRLTLRIGPSSRDDESVQDKLIRIKNLITSTRDFRRDQFKTAAEGAFTYIETPEISKLYGVDMFLHGKYQRLSEIYSALDPSELDSMVYLTGSKQQRQEL